MNLKKSHLNPTLDLVYIGVRFRVDLGTLYLLEERIDRLLALVRSFSRVGHYKQALLYLSLLSLMAATLQMVEYANLHMHPIQWFLKQHWNHAIHGLRRPILVTRILAHELQWWTIFHKECPFCYPVPPLPLLWMRAWRVGVDTAVCQGRRCHSSAHFGPSRNAGSTSMS